MADCCEDNRLPRPGDEISMEGDYIWGKHVLGPQDAGAAIQRGQDIIRRCVEEMSKRGVPIVVLDLMDGGDHEWNMGNHEWKSRQYFKLLLKAKK